MHILGVVKDAVKEIPLPGAKVSLFIGEKELAVLYSDDEGQFEHKEVASYSGEILLCHVEKEKYHFQKVSHAVEQEEVPLEIELVPVEEEKIGFKVHIKDENGNPLEAVNMTVEVEGKQIDSGVTNKHGFFEISLSQSLEGRTLNYKAYFEGLKQVKNKIKLERETSCEITMKKIPSRIWPKILAVLVAVVFAEIISIFLRNPAPIITVTVFLVIFLFLRFIFRFVIRPLIKTISGKWEAISAASIAGIVSIIILIRSIEDFNSFERSSPKDIGEAFSLAFAQGVALVIPIALGILLIILIFIILLIRLIYAFVSKRREKRLSSL